MASFCADPVFTILVVGVLVSWTCGQSWHAGDRVPAGIGIASQVTTLDADKAVIVILSLIGPFLSASLVLIVVYIRYESVVSKLYVFDYDGDRQRWPCSR